MMVMMMLFRAKIHDVLLFLKNLLANIRHKNLFVKSFFNSGARNKLFCSDGDGKNIQLLYPISETIRKKRDGI